MLSELFPSDRSIKCIVKNLTLSRSLYYENLAFRTQSIAVCIFTNYQTDLHHGTD